MATRGQKTEKPTPKKLQDARDRGNVPRTTELSGALTILGLVFYFSIFGRDWIEQLAGVARRYFGFEAVALPLTPQSTQAMLHELGMASIPLVLFPLLAVGGISVAGQVVQAPPSFTLKPLRFDLSKLDPIKGIGKLFRIKAWVDLLKASFKVGLVLVVGATTMIGVLEGEYTRGSGPGMALHSMVALGRALFLRVGALLLGLSLLDLLFTRWNHARNLRMTKQEVKDERKQSEGDPLVKGRIRSAQMQASRNRMIAEVSEASVVITNPTHYAVALRYDSDGPGVPQVVAKGVDRMAQRIREAADEHGVPIHRDPPLARSLYKAVEVGEFIPETLFRAVAEVLALVLGRRGSR